MFLTLICPTSPWYALAGWIFLLFLCPMALTNTTLADRHPKFFALPEKHERVRVYILLINIWKKNWIIHTREKKKNRRFRISLLFFAFTHMHACDRRSFICLLVLCALLLLQSALARSQTIVQFFFHSSFARIHLFSFSYLQSHTHPCTYIVTASYLFPKHI